MWYYQKKVCKLTRFNFFQHFIKRDREDAAENTSRIKITTSSVLLEITCTQIIFLGGINFQNFEENKTVCVVT